METFSYLNIQDSVLCRFRIIEILVEFEILKISENNVFKQPRDDKFSRSVVYKYSNTTINCTIVKSIAGISYN